MRADNCMSQATVTYIGPLEKKMNDYQDTVTVL